KASYLGAPTVAPSDLQTYLSSLAAISYRDVAFAIVAWACARLALAATRDRRSLATVMTAVLVFIFAVCAVYAIINVVVFGIFGGFLTYAVLELVGNVRMLSSSVAAYMTPRIVAGLVGVPLVYLLFVWISVRVGPKTAAAWRSLRIVAATSLIVWLAFGYYAY